MLHTHEVTGSSPVVSTIIEDLCNGSTPDSDSVCGGSNPSSSAIRFTLDTYGHVTEKMKKDSADRIQAFIKSVS